LIADVAGLCAELGITGFASKDTEREAHREASGYTSFGNVAHQISLSLKREPDWKLTPT
jgi:hypothetical protein